MKSHKFSEPKMMMLMSKHKLKLRQQKLEKLGNQIIQSSYRNDAQSSERLVGNDNQSVKEQ